MTTTQTAGDRIAASLRRIRTAWPHMLPDSPITGTGEPVKGSKEPPLPVSVTVLSLRRETCEVLVSWVRLVVDEVLDVNGRTMHVHLDGRDAPGMAGWLITWADWLGEHETSDVADDELGRYSRQCDDVVTQRRTRRFRVGPCIDHATSDAGERVPCTGTLVAVLSTADDLLPSELRCTVDPQHAYSAADWRRLGERIHLVATPTEPTKETA